MNIKTESIHVKTKGNNELIDITNQVQRVIDATGMQEGNVLVFAVGATAGLTTIEYEPGLLVDYPALMEKLIPKQDGYKHNETWNDGNGFSHLRASLQGPSLQVPFKNGRMMLGTWQQITFIDFDNRPRSRDVVVQVTGI